MLLAGDGGASVAGRRGKTDAVPFVAPHVPDEPTEAEVLCLLRQMTYSVCHLALGQPLALNDSHNPPGAVRYDLVPVMGVCWCYLLHSETVTVYIDNQPYAMPKSWLPPKKWRWNLST